MVRAVHARGLAVRLVERASGFLRGWSWFAHNLHGSIGLPIWQVLSNLAGVEG
jgi:hypothetical protein